METGAGTTEGEFWGEVDDEVALERYRTLVNTIDDGIYQLDASGRFVAVNDVIVDITSYSRDELVGEHVSLLLDDDDVVRIARRIRTSLESETTGIETIEVTVETADGDRVPLELRINLLVDDGTFRGTIGVARDCSEKKHRKETLESTQASYESITDVLDEANIGVFVLDDEFEVAWADETIAQYAGLDRDDLVGRDKRRLINETVKHRFDDSERFAETVLATYDDNTYVERFECRLTAGDDETQWLEHYSKPIESGRYAGGRIELYYDITDRKDSEGVLQETEEEFYSLVDAVEEYAIFRLDSEGYVTSWNEGAKEIKGYEREEILGEHFSTFYTDGDRATNVPERNLEKATENGSVEDEGWRLRKDGTRFWANVTITAVRDPDGALQGYVKVTRDMTDRRKHERKLESELQRIFGRISDAFYAVDENFRFTHVNDRAAELLQRSEEDLIGEKLWNVFPSTAEDDEVLDAFQTAMRSQEATSYEVYYETLDFWAEANLYPSETGISVYFRDVTERKEREQALEESEQRYRTLAEYFPNGIVALFDHTLEYSLAAGRGFDRIPMDPADLEGQNFHDVWPDETSDTLEPALLDALDGEARSVELSYADREWAIHAVPIIDERGNVFAGMKMAQDITERKEYQRKLEETVAQLEASNERLEQFAYAASHDLQEPLRMISSYLQLIEQRYADALDEDGEEFLEFAVDGADRMREMIDGLLEYSRVEARGEPLEPLDLDTVVEDVLDDLRLRIEEHDAEITVEDLPRVEGDAGQLRQVFQNLLSNAIQYSGDEPPRIDVSAERSGSMWTISVTDQGIGIDPEETDRVFEVFQRLHSRDEHAGTGIGLALCQRIVERHGGEIWLESEPGEGSTFSFTLPAADE